MTEQVTKVINPTPAAEGVREALLLPYQSDVIYDGSQVIIIEKSRRIGLSWGIAAEAAMVAAASRQAGGMDVWYIGYNQDMAKEFIRDAAMWTKAFNKAIQDVEIEEEIIDDEGKDIITYSIKFESGFRITALSSRPANLRGKQGLIIIDEAAFHDDLPGLIKAAMAMLIWGGRVVIISTHDGEDNYFNLLIKDCRAGKLPYSVHRIPFRQALEQGLYKRICQIRKIQWSQEAEDQWVEEMYKFYGDDAAEELDVIPSSGSGVYISRVLVERVQKPEPKVIRIKRDDDFVTDPNRLDNIAKWCEDSLKPLIDNMPGLRTVFGQDFGRSGDLSTMHIRQKVSNTFWQTPFIVELRNIPFDCQQYILFYILDNVPLFFHAKFDARGNGQSHAEAALQRYGADRVDCVMFTRAWYAKWFPEYKAGFEGLHFDLPESEDIVADHRRVVLHKGQPRMDDKHDKGSDGGQRHGDTAVSGVLSWAATYEEGEPPAAAPPEATENYNHNEVYAPKKLAGKQRIRMRAEM